MSVREIYTQSLKVYKEGVGKGLYSLSEKDIKILSRADFFRSVAIGEGGCSLTVQIEASKKLLKLRETASYIEAEDKLFAGRN